MGNFSPSSKTSTGLTNHHKWSGSQSWLKKSRRSWSPRTINGLKNLHVTDGKVWFREAMVKDNTEELAMVCPFPPLWAYDAFTEDAPAHIMWERVLATDEEDCKKVGEYAKNWLKAVHTAQNLTNQRKIKIENMFFMERPGATSSKWACKQVATLYPLVGSTFVAPSGGTPGALPQNLGTNNTLNPTGSEGEMLPGQIK